jgi:hypothetical protein
MHGARASDEASASLTRVSLRRGMIDEKDGRLPQSLEPPRARVESRTDDHDLPEREGREAGAHVTGEVEGGDAGTEREGGESVAEIVDPTQRLDPGCGLPFVPDTTGASGDQTTPVWVYFVAYSSMGLTGLYSYLRARSSNRRLEGDVPSGNGRRSPEVRKRVLKRELGILAADRWRLVSEGQFDAVVSRVKRPNHLLHAVLTLMTLYLWAFVWIAKTREARRNQELEYRRLEVDEEGNWSVEPVAGL